MQQKIVILGHLGMLGQELKRVFEKDPNYEVFAWDKDTLDVTNFTLLGERLSALRPDIVINAVAYNAVDRCEESDEEYEEALLLNRDVPRFLAEKSRELGFVLVHYSTDYVFDGTIENGNQESGGCQGGCCGGNCHGGEKGYAEDAVPNPISRYGQSKLFGEQAVVENASRYYLIRLSKLFGHPAASPGAKKSFFETMLEVAKTKERVSAVNGEKSAFTYAPDLAQATKDILSHEDVSGIYHLTNSGGATWYDGVRELYNQAVISVEVEPIAEDDLPRPAKRPAFSVLKNTKRPPLRPYQQALAEFLKNTP